MRDLSTGVIRLKLDHWPKAKLLKATFFWTDSDYQTNQTYMIRINKFVCFMFDARTPVRPTALILDLRGAELSLETLGNFIGTSLAQAIIDSRTSGLRFALTSLSADSRFALASLQAASEATPANLRKLCQSMLQEHMRATGSPETITDQIDKLLA